MHSLSLYDDITKSMLVALDGLVHEPISAGLEVSVSAPETALPSQLSPSISLSDLPSSPSMVTVPETVCPPHLSP